MKLWIALASVLILTGCTQPYHEPQLGIDHPANPDSAAAPLPQRSQALAHEAPMRANREPMAPASAPASNSALYVCPMHPQVTSDKPDQRCPECGMKLVPKSEVDGHR